MSRIDLWTSFAGKATCYLAGMGGVIILIQMCWISYGVFVRYALNSPDSMVTEATALLLFPVAFAGLAYAMHEDAYPKVTILTDRLSDIWRIRVDIINFTLMSAIGLFLGFATFSATVRSFYSGSTSEILLWPRFWFWALSALSLLVFVVYSVLRLMQLIQKFLSKRDN